MSDRLNPQAFEVLLDWVLQEYEVNRSIFGIPESRFYRPRPRAPYVTEDLYGQRMETPVGPAAGPHTQLAQNVVCAWLSGARFIELKTVQVNDELDIPRPCIDMEDEGYNVEWSQELRLEQSAEEYIKAWGLLHILRRLLGFEHEAPFGTIFNMSVGYDLEGIKSPQMTSFMDRLQDGSADIERILVILRGRFPSYADIEIPPVLVNNVTLSTMHGCPPDEIESIARYLLEERKLHTTVKLNPTLLGREEVTHILHDALGFEDVHVPVGVFDHDLQYDRAVELVSDLRSFADSVGRVFGVKLSNTLATANHKGNLPGEEMYMSGRALYPITMSLFRTLLEEFDGDLPVSYSAGADTFNLAAILSCGARPVTVVSDLLKPGGYSRMLQYVELLEDHMRSSGNVSLDSLAGDRLSNVRREADRALVDERYKKSYHPHGLPKVEDDLGPFDCITAPCKARCAVHQDVPEYAWLIAQGRYDDALSEILNRNPLPAVTGYVCTHLCQNRCTRSDYDQPVAIRALKRFAAEHGEVKLEPPESTGHSAAIVGSGPSGLAAAFFLAMSGVEVTVFEARDRPGGMLALAPVFRLPEHVVRQDVDRITGLGVRIECSHPVSRPPEDLLREGFDAVYLATGAPKGRLLGIDGEDGVGVFQALEFLAGVRAGKRFDLGTKVLVVGGGNSAMDAARTAKRITAGGVTVVYRRTRREMPATPEELEGLLAEGIALEELASPTRVKLENGHVSALECVRNRMGEAGPDGRRVPVGIADSVFTIPAHSVITAIGQFPDTAVFGRSGIRTGKNGVVLVDEDTGHAGPKSVYAGGDVVRGPAIIIEACADGRRAAESICGEIGVDFWTPRPKFHALSEEEVASVKDVRSRRSLQHRPALLNPECRAGFDTVEATLSEEAASAEARRCLQCSTVCDKCVEVCPNRANLSYRVPPLLLSLPVLTCQQDRVVIADHQRWALEQSYQILHVDDFCNECGNCATFCVHQGRPYADKPRLFLRAKDFLAEDRNAYFILRGADGWVIQSREGNETLSLNWQSEDGAVIFNHPRVAVTFALPDFAVRHLELKQQFPGTLRVDAAAAMFVVLRGAVETLPFLPFAGSPDSPR